uniref:MYND-type domain-containing protein n=1 Tax=Mycena chlorophos TaxID=658473 RepID=A0ABQ0L963_MYCCL|nr:predicted protein [Mycena chlorophos]
MPGPAPFPEGDPRSKAPLVVNPMRPPASLLIGALSPLAHGASAAIAAVYAAARASKPADVASGSDIATKRVRELTGIARTRNSAVRIASFSPSLVTFALFKAVLAFQRDDFLENHMFLLELQKKNDVEVTSNNVNKAFQVVQDRFIPDRELARVYEVAALEQHWLGTLRKDRTRVRILLVMHFGPGPDDQRVSAFGVDYTTLISPLWRYDVRNTHLAAPFALAYREYFRYSIREGKETIHLRLLLFVRLVVERKVVVKYTNTLINKISAQLRAVTQDGPPTQWYSAVLLENITRQVVQQSRVQKEKRKAAHAAMAEAQGCSLLEWPKEKNPKAFVDVLSSIIPRNSRTVDSAAAWVPPFKFPLGTAMSSVVDALSETRLDDVMLILADPDGFQVNWLHDCCGPRTMCTSCGLVRTRKTPLKACGACRNFYYCSKKCQSTHWNLSHITNCVPEHVLRDPDLVGVDEYMLQLLVYRGIGGTSLAAFGLWLANYASYGARGVLATCIFVVQVIQEDDFVIQERNLGKAFKLSSYGLLTHAEFIELVKGKDIKGLEGFGEEIVDGLPKGRDIVRVVLSAAFKSDIDGTVNRLTAYTVDIRNIFGCCWPYDMCNVALGNALYWLVDRFLGPSLSRGKDTLYLRILLETRFKIEGRVDVRITKKMLNHIARRVPEILHRDTIIILYHYPFRVLQKAYDEVKKERELVLARKAKAKAEEEARIAAEEEALKAECLKKKRAKATAKKQRQAQRKREDAAAK